MGATAYPTTVPVQGFTLPTNLPKGARVNSIRFYTIDDVAGDITFAWQRLDPAAGSYLLAPIASTTGFPQSTSIQAKTMPVTVSNVIDPWLYSYRLYMKAPAAGTNNRYFGARVYYTIPTIYIPVLRR